MIKLTDNSRGIIFITIIFILLAVLVTAGVFVFGKVVKQQKIGQSRNVVLQAKHSIIGYAAAYKKLPLTLADAGARTVDDWGNTLEYFYAKEADNITPLNPCSPSGVPNPLTVTGDPDGVAFIVMSKGPNGTNDTGTGPFTISTSYDDIVEYSDIATLRANVCHNMRITTDSLPTGTEEFAYPSTTLTATDGTTPYAWSLSLGSLPSGLALQTSGTCGIFTCTASVPCICGTPTTDGNYTFTVQIQDAEGRIATKNLTIVINPNKPRITTAFLNKGTQDVAYPTATLSATGGKLSYTWSLTSGSLPTGLNPLSAGGVISGTPTAAGTFTFTVTVTDSGSPVRTASRTLSIVIGSPACTALTNTTPAPMAGGATGSAYSQNITYTGGQGAVTCSIPVGTLPAGLTRTGCTISGTPTTAGTSSFTTRVTDSCGTPQTSDVATSITITLGCPTLTNTTPAPMAGGTTGSAYSQNITYTGGQGTVTCSIPVGTLPAGLTRTGCTISGTPTTAGTSSFTTRVTDSCGTPQTSDVATSITICTTSITYQTPGAIAYSASGGGSVSPAYPASIAANNLLVLIIGMKPSTANSGSVTTPSGWTAITSIVGAGGYGTTLGADTGNTNLFTFYKVAAGTESGSLTVTISTNNVSWAQMYRFSASAASTWSVAGTTGSDTSGGSSVSINFSSNPGVTAGDYILGAMCIPTDVTTPSQFSSEALSQTGITFGTVTEISEPDSSTGNNIGGVTYRAPVSSGTASAAPRFTATAGGTTTNVRGPGVFIRVEALCP